MSQRIIVVEDNDLYRAAMKSLIEARRGWKSWPKPKTATRLSKPSGGSADIVLLDLRLPDTQGTSCCSGSKPSFR